MAVNAMNMMINTTNRYISIGVEFNPYIPFLLLCNETQAVSSLPIPLPCIDILFLYILDTKVFCRNYGNT